jgi:hypothetical protein
MDRRAFLTTLTGNLIAAPLVAGAPPTRKMFSMAPVAAAQSTASRIRNGLVSPPILPTPFSLDQLLSPGPRSGTVWRVPTPYTLQQAVDRAQYGDTVLVAPSHAQTTNVSLPGETTKSKAGRPVRSNGEPSDIVILCDSAKFHAGGGTPVAPPTRVIYNSAWPSGLTVMKVSNRVTQLDAGTLPRFAVNASIAFNRYPDCPAYWRIIGFHWQATGTPFAFAADGRPWGPEGAVPVTHHITIDRCYFEGDPDHKNQAPGLFAYGYEGRHLAFINCTIDEWSGPTAGDAGGFLTGGGPGPYHFENNTVRCLNFWFSGGSGGTQVGGVPRDMVFRRNHIYRPEGWLPSEPTQDDSGLPSDPWFEPTGPYIVDIDKAGRLVTFKSMTPLWLTGFTNKILGYGGYLYDTGTGISRRVVSDPGRDSRQVLLESAWPGAPKTNLSVYPLLSNMVYCSGAGATLETATVNGTHVTFNTAPLPTSVRGEADLTPADRVAGRRAHYFYLASQRNMNDPRPRSGVAWSASLYRPAERRKIMTIAADRRSCTLENAYPTTNLLGEAVARTFAYHISRNDGYLRRGAGAYNNTGKAIMEHKMGERILFEGNVVENFREYWRIHPSNQWETRGTVSVTVAGNTFRINDPGFALPSWMVAMIRDRHLHGDPWPYVPLCQGANMWTGQVAIVDTLNGLTGTLIESSLPNGTYQGTFLNMPTPWAIAQDFTIRYNKSRHMATGPSIHGNAINAAEIRHGQRFAVVHNLMEDHGGANLGSMGVADGIALACFSGREAGAALHMGSRYAHWPSPAYGSNSPIRVSHNTFARMVRSYSAGMKMATVRGEAVPDAYERASDLEFNDNVVDGLTNGANGDASLLGGNPVTEGFWTPPYSVARNAVAGDGAVTAVAAVAGTFPDNAGVVSADSLGYVDRATGNYRLRDVFTGTGTIGGDGSTFTLISGNFPATVVAGQFAWLSVNGARRRIVGPPRGGTIRWSGDIGNHHAATRVTVGFKGSATDGTDPGANIDDVDEFTAGVDTLVEPDAVPARSSR